MYHLPEASNYQQERQHRRVALTSDTAHSVHRYPIPEAAEASSSSDVDQYYKQRSNLPTLNRGLEDEALAWKELSIPLKDKILDALELHGKAYFPHVEFTDLRWNASRCMNEMLRRDLMSGDDEKIQAALRAICMHTQVLLGQGRGNPERWHIRRP
ncbi:hypothetical protein CBS101457_002982 [Exobasidium rhododendri]|nr:hypothetical protein CBS101457_002982 [Exobasidium rhododendri]